MTLKDLSSGQQQYLLNCFKEILIEHEPAIVAYLTNLLKAQKEAEEIIELLDNGGMSDFYNMKPVSGMAIVALCSMVTDDTAAKAQALLAEERRQSGINANAARVRKFNTVKEALHKHWKEYIDPNKVATEAAIILENTDIFKDAKPQQRRATLAEYVREWQSLPTDKK